MNKKQKVKTIPIHVKMSAAQLKAIKRKAELNCEGNLSKWMRYAALHFNPHEGEIIKG
jgi:hypothetical protein